MLDHFVLTGLKSFQWIGQDQRAAKCFSIDFKKRYSTFKKDTAIKEDNELLKLY